jgi:hypothetical protein
MAKKHTVHRPTLREIVADLDASPAPLEPDQVVPGKYSGDTLYDPDGHALVEAGERALTPDEVRAAVQGGARLAWDDCGCGGYCNEITWPEPSALADAAAAGSPRYGKNDGSHVRLLTGNGGDVVLAEGRVRWGDLLH